MESEIGLLIDRISDSEDWCLALRIRFRAKSRKYTRKEFFPIFNMLLFLGLETIEVNHRDLSERRTFDS